DAIAADRAARIALGGSETAARGLYIGNQIDQVFDGLIVLLQRHSIGEREPEAQSELGLGEPAIEVMPEEPGRDRLRRRLDEKDALPRDEDIVEPHLAVELVEARRERRDEGIGMARGQFEAYGHDTGIGDRNDKARIVLVDLDA